jgi:RNA polymerase sigma factor (sigma-70 family)
MVGSPPAADAGAMSSPHGFAGTAVSDADLVQHVSSGDDSAFAVLDARHRPALIRYAASLLRSRHDAEDVVQDVLIRVHHALRHGGRPDELRPWLYRMTRNRAIDELRRVRWGVGSLADDDLLGDDRRADPAGILVHRESLHHLLEDLAGLPQRQREALLARELEGRSPAQVAAQLGVSVMAAQKLVARARANLVKTRDARDTDCRLIVALLLDAHARGVRPTEHAVRHVGRCDSCRAYQCDIRRLAA